MDDESHGDLPLIQPLAGAEPRRTLVGMKITVVGAGSVGTAIAYSSAIQGVADEIALYDVDGAKATAEVLDLRHGLQFVPPVTVDGGDDLDVCRGADVVVITARGEGQP